MGCWDVFCFLCGNICHSSYSNLKEAFLEDINYWESDQKKSKWFNKYFPPIYESYSKNPKLFLEKINNIKKTTKWLDKCSFLVTDNKIVHGVKEEGCNIEFVDKNGNLYYHNTTSEDQEMNGVFVHTDCWKFVKKEYGIALNYSYLPIVKRNQLSTAVFEFVNYGPITKYWGQDFNFINIIVDSNEELCESPLKSKLVAKNIKKVLSKLKIKKDKERKGPLVSATFYKNGHYKVGINGNIWVIKSNKWNEIKETIKHKFSTKNELEDLVYYGDVNNKPMFILKINNNKKLNEYEILTTKDYLEKLK